jgi:hypothetical protein
MKAITTKYHGATNSRGSRIIASDGDRNRVSIPYPHEAHQGEEAHSLAAIALCRKMNWNGRLIAGSLKDGYVFVWAEGDSYEVAVLEADGSDQDCTVDCSCEHNCNCGLQSAS